MFSIGFSFISFNSIILSASAGGSGDEKAVLVRSCGGDGWLCRGWNVELDGPLEGYLVSCIDCGKSVSVEIDDGGIGSWILDGPAPPDMRSVRVAVDVMGEARRYL